MNKPSRTGMRFRLVCVLCFLTVYQAAWAHLPEDSYLFLRDDQGATSLTWDISAGNLAELMTVDTDASGEIDEQELLSVQEEVFEIAARNLMITQSEVACEMERSDYTTTNYTSGLYASLKYIVTCAGEGPVTLSYSLMFGVESGHRGILLYNWVEGNAARFEFIEGRSSLTLTPANLTSTQFATPDEKPLESGANPTSWLTSFKTYVKEGVWHIWIGIDHILFIVTLLLPAALVWRDRHWQAAAGWRPTLIETVKIVTAFTLAHSITLTMSTLGWVSLPARFTESVIAFSVLVVALNNVRPFFVHGRWSLAFLFGLLHGFGFAYVLGDLGLHSQGLLVSLAGFNVGVELGQLAIVLVLLPILYLMRRSHLYQKFLMPAASAVMALIALIWMVERIAGVEWLGF